MCIKGFGQTSMSESNRLISKQGNIVAPMSSKSERMLQMTKLKMKHLHLPGQTINTKQSTIKHELNKENNVNG